MERIRVIVVFFSPSSPRTPNTSLTCSSDVTPSKATAGFPFCKLPAQVRDLDADFSVDMHSLPEIIEMHALAAGNVLSKEEPGNG